MIEIQNTVQSIRVCQFSRENDDFKKEVKKSYESYLNGRWGSVASDQMDINDEALSSNRIEQPIIGVYNTSLGNLYIVTQVNGQTKVLMEEEF